MLGRNDLCRCGSGKKYKKCCMNADLISERVARQIKLLKEDYADLYSKIYDHSIQDKFKKDIYNAKKQFFVIDDDDINKKFDVFFNTYFMQDYILSNKKVVTIDFYEEFSDKLTHREVDLLNGIFESHLSVYEIVGKEPGSIRLLDCITDDIAFTQDENLLKEFKVGNYIIARIVNINEGSLLIDITLSITNDIKNIVVDDVNALYNKYKGEYKDKKLFLSRNTLIFYKYIQQLMDSRVGEYLRNKEKYNEKFQEDNSTFETKLEEPKNTDCKVYDIIIENTDKCITKQCLKLWNNYIDKSKAKVKSSEYSWAAAIEYYIKKEDGITVTQAEVASKYGISASTLAKRLKTIKELI